MFRCTQGHVWREEKLCPQCGSAAAETIVDDGSPSPTGRLPSVPGYELLAVVGEGGMGVVYRARHIALGREVALKVIISGEHARQQDRQRFQIEAQVVARLQHPNIVQVYDVGEVQGQPYYTMEFIRGHSLRSRMKRGSMTDREIAELMATLSRAVEHAHQHGVVHRDLKPDNVLMTDAGVPKLTDFGVAKRLTSGDGLTETGRPIGTPSYMAPEQAAGRKEIGPAADVYALGAMLYELLAGHPPFSGDNLYDMMHKVMTEDPVSPAWYRPGVPRDLEVICLKCLQKKPDDRYTSAGELAADLQRYLDRQPISARRTPVWERAIKWARRRPTLSGSLGIFVLALALLAGVGAWAYDRYWRVHVEYFGNWTKAFGVYQGVGKLTPAQVRQRPSSYKFSSRRGRVERVDVVDANGMPTRDAILRYLDAIGQDGTKNKRECTYVMERDSAGRLTDEVAYDRDGQVVWRFHYTSATTGAFTDAQGYPIARNPSGAAYVEFQRDANGFDVEYRYRDKNQQPKPDVDGVYGWRLEHDDSGLIRRITLLDVDGKPFRTRNGYAIVEFDHGELGQTRAVRLFDADGKPTRCLEGFSSWEADSDEFGRESETRYFDETGKPVRQNFMAPKLVWTYASPVDVTVRHVDDPPGPPHTANTVRTVTTQDGDQRIQRLEVFDETGRRARNENWVSIIVNVFDRHGQAVEKTYLGPDEKPTFFKNGVAREVMKYDERGRMTEWAGFGADGQPTRNGDGFAGVKREYDALGNCIDESFFDPQGKATRDINGVSRRIMKFAPGENRLVSEEYLGPDGQPTLCRYGYQRIQYKHDALGHVSEIEYFGTDTKPAWHRDGYMRLRQEHDARGLLTRRVPLGPDGEPIEDNQGRCDIRYERDAWGNAVKETHFGPDGKPRYLRDGYVAVQREYDCWGNASEAYFGAHGERVLGADGYWQERTIRNNTGRIIGFTYHGIDGSLTRHANGYAEVRRENLGPGGFFRRWRYFGPDGRPALLKGECPVIERDYDDRGRMTLEAYFDSEGKPVLSSEACASVRNEYDARGRRSATLFFGADGKPCRHRDGYERVDYDYDDRGNKAGERYSTTQGTPATGPDRVWRLRWTYDDRSRETRKTFHGVNDELTVGEPSYAERVTQYDARGNRTSVEYFDPAHKPCLHREGNAKVVWVCNERDFETEHAFFGLDMKPKVIRPYGYARRSMRYDSRGNMLEETYFGEGEARIRCPAGYSRLKAEYAPIDRRVRVDFFDTDDKPMRCWAVVGPITPGRQAYLLGLHTGDVLVSYDGKPITDANQFIRGREGELPADPPRELRVRRGTEELTFTIKPGKLGATINNKFERIESP